MSKPPKPVPLTQADRDAAFVQGWTDSLQGYVRHNSDIGWDRLFDYGKGWHVCARERWKRDPEHGVMPPDGQSGSAAGDLGQPGTGQRQSQPRR